MRKSIYTLMVILGIISLISFLFFPIYKFNDEKIKKYNYETYAILTIGTDFTVGRDNTNLSKLEKEVQEAYKENYYTVYTLIDSVIKDDYTVYAKEMKYEILNKLYEKKLGSSFNLDANSSTDTIMAVEKTLKDLYQESYEASYEEEAKTLFNEFKDKTINIVKDASNEFGMDNYEDIIIYSGKKYICNELLLMHFGRDAEIEEFYFDKACQNGIYLKDLLTACKTCINHDLNVYNSLDSSLTGAARFKAMFDSEEFCNPFPLFGAAILFVVLVVASLIFIICGLIGIKGNKYPQTFIRSIIFGTVAVTVVFGPLYIPQNFLFKYHDIEFSRLLNLITFTDAGLCIYITGFSFLFFIVLSVIGRFCKFGKRK